MTPRHKRSSFYSRLKNNLVKTHAGVREAAKQVLMVRPGGENWPLRKKAFKKEFPKNVTRGGGVKA